MTALDACICEALDDDDDVEIALQSILDFLAQLEARGIDPADICTALAIAHRLTDIEMSGHAAPDWMQ